MADRFRIVQVLGNLLSNAATALAGIIRHKGECYARRSRGLSVSLRRRQGHSPLIVCRTYFRKFSQAAEQKSREETPGLDSRSARG